MKYRDLTGQRFGRLSVINLQPRESRYAHWLCRCDCGNTAVVRGTFLVSGHTQSCGCVRNEKSSERVRKRNVSHGESHTRLYEIWIDVRKRCNNPKHWAFARYGGRGIAVCAEWNHYENFARWSKCNGYSADLTLDRIDNDGPYSPSNCRWVDRSVQARNKSNNVVYAFAGECLTVPEWSEKTGIKASTLYNRLTTYGWTVERALTTPARRHKPYEFKEVSARTTH